VTPAQAFDAQLRLSLGLETLIGVDEAGRGPLAGPVVVAAVRLGWGPHQGLQEVRDSKKLSAVAREKLYDPIVRAAEAVSVSWAHPRQIERQNILGATLSSMRRAVLRLGVDGALVLVDGNKLIPQLPYRQMAVVDVDDLSLAVGCASVIAKVFRDRWMRRLDKRYPGYGFARHKGYGTEEHLAALRKLGPSPVHRRTYAPVSELLSTDLALSAPL
jgi:ribonuclease HII